MPILRCCVSDGPGASSCRKRISSPPTCSCSASEMVPTCPLVLAKGCARPASRPVPVTALKAMTVRSLRSRCRGSAIVCRMHTGDYEGCHGGSDDSSHNSNDNSKEFHGDSNDNNNSNKGGNNNGNNNRSGGPGGSGGSGDHDDRRPLKFDWKQATLGALALTFAFAAFPAPSRAGPGALSTSPTTTTFGFLHRGSTSGAGASASPAGPYGLYGPDSSPMLSSSAPTRGGFLSEALGRSSLDMASGSRPSSSGYRAGASASAVSSSSSGPSPSRPRSKVMHVATKGGTLVVPLPANTDPAKAPGPLAARLPPWQRRKIVEAPIELSEKEARMVDSRQNRVRDSLLV